MPACSIAAALALVAGNLLLPGACTDEAAARWGVGDVAGRTAEWWRIAISFIPHAGWLHLVLNAVYLVGVGWFVEPMIGRARTILVLALCQAAGALAVLSAAQSGYVETGASNAIHGLLACGYVVGIRRARTAATRAICLAGLTYFAYMSLNAVWTGHMPWPLEFFRNNGWGHLGGIVIGAVLGLVAAPQNGGGGVPQQPAAGGHGDPEALAPSGRRAILPVSSRV